MGTSIFIITVKVSTNGGIFLTRPMLYNINTLSTWILSLQMNASSFKIELLLSNIM